MNDQDKKLNLMKFWLFGAFVIFFVATTVYTGGAVQLGLEILKQANYWIAMAVTAVLCVAWYFLYKWYLNRK